MKNLVQIYKFRQEGSKQKFVCPIPGFYNGGKRWFRRFETKTEAEEFQDEFNRDPYGTVARLKNVTPGANLAPLKRTDKQAAEFLFQQMCKILKTDDVVEGIQAFRNHAERFSFQRITVTEAIAEYHAHRATRNLDARVLADDKTRLSKLAIRFGPSQLAAVTTDDLRRLFADIPLGEDGKASNRITYRMKIGPFFTWAHEEAKYIKENPISRISKTDLGQMGVNNEFYSVDQFAQMLAIAREEFRDTLFPWFIVSGFAGLRTSEAMRETLDGDALRWDDIYFDAETPHIHIRAEIAKGGRERHIEAPWAIAAVRSWLGSEGVGFVCPTERQIQNAKARFTESTGITLNENGLRNSFGTYGRAVLGSTDLIAEQMGNSPAVAKKYYVRSLPTGRGQAYFGLRPLALIQTAA
jgi:integrase